MRKKNLYVFLALIVISLNSCKKDDKKDDPYNYPNSTYTVEQDKTNVDEAASEFVTETSGLENANAIQILIHMGELMDNEPAPAPPPPPAAEKKKAAIKSIGFDGGNTEEIMTSLKAATEDPNSFSELWTEIAAQYTWNFNTEEFDSLGSPNALIIYFPGLDGQTTNTAKVTVDGFETVVITDPFSEWPEDMDPEMITALHGELEYNNEVVATFDFSASYQSDGMPIKVTCTLTIEDFTLMSTATHKPYSSASTTQNLKKGTKLLYEVHMEAAGNWSDDNIDTNEDNPEEIVNNANAYLIIMNIKIAGKVNIKTMADGIKLVEDNELLTEEEACDEIVNLINDNADLVVVYADSKKKIAEAEAYKYLDEYDDSYYPDIRFIFSDDSNVDGETYAKQEFTNLVNALNDFIAELNDEYDAEIDPIEYGD